MKKQLQLQLYEKYPKIFVQKDLTSKETAMCWGLSCGDGWYHIIDMLCKRIQDYIDRPHEMIAYYQQEIIKLRSNDNYDENRLKYLQEQLDETKTCIIDQPEAVQVKQKWGTLRFYLNGYDDSIRNWVSFAETMSSVTCEECGRPGSQNKGPWVKTLCTPCKHQFDQNRKSWIDEAKQLKIPFGE